MSKTIIMGYYGCDCHPYKSWKELKFYENQKLQVGDIVKHRCTGRVGEILGNSTEWMYPQDKPRYLVTHKKSYNIKYGEIPRDHQTINVQNAIVIKRKLT